MKPGFMDGIITDIHIYDNTLEDAQAIVMNSSITPTPL